MTGAIRRLLYVAAMAPYAVYAVVSYSIGAPLWYDVLGMPAAETAYWVPIKVAGIVLAVLAGFAAYQLYRSFRPLGDGGGHDDDGGGDPPDGGDGSSGRVLPAEAYGR